MKQRTSFILKGLISLVLSLVMLCGTAVTSLSAVTVDLAETGENIVTLYFTNIHNWRNVSAHLWNSSTGEKISEWPGEAMVYVGINGSNQNIYSVSFDADKYDQVIFNGKDGSGYDKQTVDVSVATAISNGCGVYCWNTSESDGKYKVEYYTFNSSTSSSSTGLDHDRSYYIGKENSNRYVLEPYGTNQWVIKDGNKYLKLEGAGTRWTGFSWNATSVADAAKWTFGGFDNAWQNLEGAIFTAEFSSTTVYILYTNDNSFTVYTNPNYRIAASLIVPIPKNYSVTVTKKSTTDNYNYNDDAEAGVVIVAYGDQTTTYGTTVSNGTVSGIEDGTTVTLTATASEGYTFLGWFAGESWVKLTDSYQITINGNNVNVIARYSKNQSPVTGTYKFTYDRRNIEVDGENTTWTKTVTRQLVGAEIDGYDGNGYNSGMPTYLYTSRAKMLFGNSPLLTASLAVQGNDDEQDNVSTYKNDIVWPDMASVTLSEGITLDTTNKTVTVTATTTPLKFVFKYVIKSEGDTVHEGAAQVSYAKAVTFNPIYKGDSRYQYVEDEIPETNFSYWSADPIGDIPITTNRTFGMLLRGDYTDDGDDETIVTVYAQYGKTPANDWNPLIEETKLTRTIADDGVDWVWADYMTNYLSKDGSVVQNMIDAGNTNIKYGLFVMKYPTGNTAVSIEQSDMETTAKKLIDYYHTNGKSSAYIKDTDHIGYVYEYSDKDHISDFNRTLYTIKCSSAKAENMTFSAVAYITVDGENYFYSAVNSDIVIKDLVD